MNRTAFRLKRLTKYDNRLSLSSIIGIQALHLAIWFEIAINLPTGLGLGADLLFCLLLCAFGNAGTFLLALLLSFAMDRIPLCFPRLLFAFITSIMIIVPATLTYMNMNLKGAFLFTGGVICSGILIGLFVSLLLFKLLKTPQRRMIFTVGIALLSVVWFVLTDLEVLQSAYSKISDPESEIDSPLISPSSPGRYEVQSFTYGSGKDKRRNEFGSGAELISPTVDASGFITKWSKLRTMFWGFGPNGLPLNGRVWLPQGEGPFPVVFIVHGNHTMEDYSDTGYAYLGELLASRGFLTVSVDQNFINYSVYSDIPNDDYALRAWLLLHHLKTFDRFSQTTDSILYGKADMNAIALIGHSRGGQAAALAADYDRFFREAGKDKMLAHISYPIRSVIAIAPTDKRLENKFVKLKDINYLTLHGAYDSDVTTFDGDRFYDRISFSDKSSEYFLKASLYIERANHGQFNTEWGKMDIKLPARWLMNTADLLSEQEQQSIAQTYISAFLETTLHKDMSYIPMLKDWRKAGSWLPDSAYISRFDDSTMIKVAGYEEDTVKETATLKQTAIEGINLETWNEQVKKNRHGGSRQNRAALVSWTDRKGSYGIRLSRAAARQITSSSKIIFSLAHASKKALQFPTDFTLRLTTVHGQTFSKPISSIQPVQPVIVSRYLNAGPLSDDIKGGKLIPSTEPVFQDYFIPLSSITGKESTFRPEQLAKIEWVFNRTPAGSIYLDEIRLQK